MPEIYFSGSPGLQTCEANRIAAGYTVNAVLRPRTLGVKTRKLGSMPKLMKPISFETTFGLAAARTTTDKRRRFGREIEFLSRNRHLPSISHTAGASRDLITMNTAYHPPTEAQQLINDQAFVSDWKRLYERCMWATAYQSIEFVTTWYKSYADRYSPILISERSPMGDLVGLLPLAVEQRAARVVVAGAHHAEYQAWLSLPENGNSFITRGLKRLAQELPISRLSFNYLPPGTPVDWTDSQHGGSWRCKRTPYSRPVIRIHSLVELADYLQKKRSHRSVKNYWNRLRRLGDLRLEEVRSAAQLSAIFDQLIAFYDTRQAAMHDKIAFGSDSLKKTFHLAMLEVPNLVRISLLKAGETIISAIICTEYRRTLSLNMPIFSPWYADNSPISLHLLLLLEQLNQQGVSTFDLTPGGDPFKERFATDHDSVEVLDVYFGPKNWFKQKAKDKVAAIAKNALTSVGVDAKTVRRRLTQLTRLRALGLSEVTKQVFRRIWSTDEMRIYALETRNVQRMEQMSLMNRNCLAELLNFEPGGVWHARQDFLAESLKRIEKGHHFYTRSENGKLVQYGWLFYNEKGSASPQSFQEFRVPARSVILYDFYTHPRSQGRGLYFAALRQMMNDAAHISDAHHIYAVLSPNNKSEYPPIEELGFSYQGSMFRATRLGRFFKWTTVLEAGCNTHRDLWDQHDRRFLRFGMKVQEASVLIRYLKARRITPGQLPVVLGRNKGKSPETVGGRVS